MLKINYALMNGTVILDFLLFVYAVLKLKLIASCYLSDIIKLQGN